MQKTTEEFISQVKEIHGNKYDYSKVEYINNHSKVLIFCKACSSFFKQEPRAHLCGQGCPNCGKRKSGQKRRMTLEEFKERANLIHGNKYDYSKVCFNNCLEKVEIICPEHGSFWQTAQHHLEGIGCPKCQQSHGERTIENYLISNGIIFEKQKKFDDLRDRSLLSYDFFLPEKNILIEYNGEQHYRSVDYFGGDKAFERQKRHDALKAKYAEKHGYKLIILTEKNLTNLSEISNIL